MPTCRLFIKELQRPSPNWPRSNRARPIWDLLELEIWCSTCGRALYININGPEATRAICTRASELRRTWEASPRELLVSLLLSFAGTTSSIDRFFYEKKKKDEITAWLLVYSVTASPNDKYWKESWERIAGILLLNKYMRKWQDNIGWSWKNIFGKIY